MAATLPGPAQRFDGPLAPTADDEPSRKGGSFGRYELEARIGAGGMGVVYRAYDPMLERRVALKIVRPALGGKAAQRRLFREAQALAKVRHPKVVAIHDVGVLGRDVYIAMEYVPGSTVTEWLAATPRSTEDILAVFRAAAAGLGAAHAAGLVHRDFKPDNVIVGDDGRVHVIDFGLAQPAELTDTVADEIGDKRDAGYLPGALAGELAVTPGRAGTPSYMAPEQLEGLPATAASDQFSFCVALFVALYDAHPFGVRDGEFITPASMTTGLTKARSDRSVRAAVRDAVARGLSLIPSDRYPSMGDLLAELSKDPRAATPTRPAAWVFAGLAVVCVAALGAGWLRGSDPGTLCTAPERWLAGVWDDDVRASLVGALDASDIFYASATAERVVRILDAFADEWTSVHTQACQATHIHGTQSEDMLDLRMQCITRANGRVTAFVRLIRDELDEGLLKNAVKAAIQATDLADCSDVSALRAQQAYPEPKGSEERARITALQERIDELNVLLTAGRARQGVELGTAVVADATELGYAPALAEARSSLGSLLRAAGDGQAADDSLSLGIADAARAGDHPGEASMIAKRIWVLGHLMDRYGTCQRQ